MTYAKAAIQHEGLQMDIEDQKRVLRRSTISRRSRMTPQERNEASETVAARLVALPEMAGDAPVLAFASFGDEVATDSIVARLLAAGRRVRMPFVEGTAMRASEIRSLDDLAPGYRGIREPVTRRAVDPAGVILVPGVAFDEAGNRLGYGGGFYDAFLAAAPHARPRIGLCFDLQIVDRVPTGPADVPVDVIVTESRVVRVEAATRDG